MRLKAALTAHGTAMNARQHPQRRLCAELPPDIPPPAQGFLLFLVINLAFG